MRCFLVWLVMGLVGTALAKVSTPHPPFRFAQEQPLPQGERYKQPVLAVITSPLVGEVAAKQRVRGQIETISFFAEAENLDWQTRQETIHETLLDLPHDQHAAGELELAWLSLGLGRATEALGYLTHLTSMRPSIAHQPIFHMLCGMSHFILGHVQEAKFHLSSIQHEPEAQLLLSLLTGPHSEEIIRKSYAMIQRYPKPLRYQMMSYLIKRSMVAKDIDSLELLVGQEPCPEVPKEAEVFKLANAKILMRQDKPDIAMQIFGELMKTAIAQDIRDFAYLDYVKHRIETKILKSSDVRWKLEQLQAQYQNTPLGNEIGAYLKDLS